MGIPENARDPSLWLRQRAEDALRGKPIDLDGLPMADVQYLLHELQVHQVELTLQNEDLRRSQLALETARDQYSHLYNVAPVGYCTVDRKGLMVEANQTLATLLGMKRDQLIHKKLSDFVDRDAQDAYYLHQRQTVEDHQRQVIDLPMAKHTGEKMTVRMESALDHADPTRVQVILSDITSRKQTEKELENYSQELERANQALRDFSFIAGHDLQEPLRKVKSFGEMLKTQYGEALGTEGKGYIDRMLSAVARMDAMLRGLLAYARVTSKGVPFAVVNLREIATEVLSDLDGRLMQTGGKVVIGEIPKVQADPLQMRQLFQNLISNALKYHRPGVPPLVQVTSRWIEKNRLEISVIDNGIGFDMQYADHIFEPFTRINGRSDYDGTGMGLAICKKIIERHGGAITVNSILDEGSTFTVTLPV